AYSASSLGICNHQVAGSSPAAGTKLNEGPGDFFSRPFVVSAPRTDKPDAGRAAKSLQRNACADASTRDFLLDSVPYISWPARDASCQERRIPLVAMPLQAMPLRRNQSFRHCLQTSNLPSTMSAVVGISRPDAPLFYCHCRVTMPQ
ncbi:hypothetical protein, partial [Burkholderia diffusa]|uniref:hypothetical protein n=1 Tax=Burkholderia diffusa TaxID=488732 RepID=UPI002AB053FE